MPIGQLGSPERYISDPEAVYTRIKNKHLMFGESREEREVRVDGEHQALMKGKLTGYQFEPLFEASIADLEAVGLGTRNFPCLMSGRCRRISRRRFERTDASGPETEGCWPPLPCHVGRVP